MNNDSMRKDKCSFSILNSVIQKHLDFEISIDVNESKIKGNVTITFIVLECNPSSIILDSNNLLIHSIKYEDDDDIDYLISHDFEISKMGTPIYMFLNRKFEKHSSFKIKINYETMGNPDVIFKIDSNDTFGKKFPFLYTECTAIGARSTFPCQDTPSSKVTARALITVAKPFKALFSGIPSSSLQSSDDENFHKFLYELKLPISTYLIVFAVADVEFVKISERCGVWCESPLINNCIENLKDVESYIEEGEKLLGKFHWEFFNMLILPTYRYYGMENPYLTYINYKAMHFKWVIFHELCHYWTGNLITNSTWENFWINEGFTTFLERKFVHNFLGKEEFRYNSKNGYLTVCHDIISKGIEHNYTSLNPFLENQDPMESYSLVPYEKGYAFIKFLQNIIGIEKFYEFLKNFIEIYKFGCVEYIDVKNFYESEVIRIHGSNKGEVLLREIDWEAWVFSTGLPLHEPNFDEI